MTLSPDSIVRRIDAVPFTRLDDEVLAVDAERGYLYALNETGGRIWELLAEPIAVSELCDQMSREYRVDHETCRAGVIQIVERLRTAGLLEVI